MKKYYKEVGVIPESMQYLTDLTVTISRSLDPEKVRTYSQLMKEYRLRRIDRQQLVEDVMPLFENDHFLSRQFRRVFHEEFAETTLTVFSDRYNPNEKNLEKISRDEAIRSRKRKRSTRDHDWDEDTTPSYRLIPEENRSCFSDPNLNNMFESVDMRRPREWYQKRQSKYKKTMFRCEDEMYEVDMLRKTLQSTIEKAEEVVNGKMKMEDVGIMFYRCIERLYEERGEEAVDEVKRESKKALRVILPRLKQKLREVSVSMEGRKPIWQKIFEQYSKKQDDSTTKSAKIQIL